MGDIVEVERVTQKGRVEFVGEVHFRPGKWVGVLFATPMGKNNGVIEGRKYFSALQNYGLFVPSKAVKLYKKASKLGTQNSSPIKKIQSFC